MLNIYLHIAEEQQSYEQGDIGTMPPLQPRVNTPPEVRLFDEAGGIPSTYTPYKSVGVKMYPGENDIPPEPIDVTPFDLFIYPPTPPEGGGGQNMYYFDGVNLIPVRTMVSFIGN